MKILIDTNAVTALKLGNATVLQTLEEADIVLISVVVLGELYFGYANGSKEQENLTYLNLLLKKPTVQILPIGEETPRIYADLRLALKKLGQPIPTNDLWIAAQSLETGALLLSNDAHFSFLIGLRRKGF